MPKITTFLTFDNQAEEAVKLYTGIFKNSKIVSSTPGPNGTVMSLVFELEGQPFYALNGGPSFTFSQGISLFVSCETQPEIDELWEKLSAGGSEQRCGWLKDKFGLSWQIVPPALGKMLGDKDRAKAGRVVEAMLGMVKLDIAGLERAYNGD
jgi:predicted 3-demethylubiquinone-9 3-methyltransferase (glyoxalase superfamily)